MKPKSIFLSLIIFISIMKTDAQIPDKSIPGEYYLEGVMEVGSGILLKEDNTFQIFFSYGSLDKTGTGTWKRDGRYIILNSDPRPASDFKLISSKKITSDGITIKVTDPNTDILRYMTCTISSKEKTDTSEADETGAFHFSMNHADSIGLVHQMFSDRMCYFDISKSADNYFEFGIEQWIMNIYCHDLRLTIHEGYLEGWHPLLEPGRMYTYRKSE